jgi:tetratricopeptide (TPR) repeat protein
VQDAAGNPVISGEARLTTNENPAKDEKYKYAFPVDAKGNYKGDGIAPGTYIVVFYQDAKIIDYFRSVKFTAGQDVAQDFDMTRKEFIDRMSPEDRKVLEDLKKKNADTNTENAKINNLNALLVQARQANKDGRYQEAATSMQQAVAIKPEEGLLWFELGEAQRGLKNNDDAIVAYKKAIELNDASKKPNPLLDAATDNNLGKVYAEAGKTADAVTAYETAAKLDPGKAIMYYNNEAATLYNKGAYPEALAAAEKAIAADPTKPMPYYIKAQVLVQSATVDKSGKIIAPAGCADAYQKYLSLDPNGQYAADVQGILQSMGETIHSTYKAGKKS